MSKANLFARHARIQTDRAISRAHRAFCNSPEHARIFRALLDAVRRRSSFLEHPEVQGERHLQVEALRNLTLFAREHRRTIDSWPGASGSILCVVASLARHLLARYAVPKFLARVWFGEDEPNARVRRWWYIEHAIGRRFRDLSIPMTMTRRMEQLFLDSPDHLTVLQAMRRAELRALGASPALVEAVLATRLGEQFENGRFWRTVMHFFIRVSHDLDLAMVGPIVDFLQAVRHETVEILAEGEPVILKPSRPEFSMKGRTLPSVLHLVEGWHRSLGLSSDVSVRWERSRHRPMIVEGRSPDDGSPPVRWEFVELLSSTDLQREGAALRHCIASYANLCMLGRSRIWSLRRRSRHGNPRSVLTIEINPARRSIVQARGLRNRPAWGQPLRLLKDWARRENLRLLI